MRYGSLRRSQVVRISQRTTARRLGDFPAAAGSLPGLSSRSDLGRFLGRVGWDVVRTLAIAPAHPECGDGK